jgi:hypothetical protein
MMMMFGFEGRSAPFTSSDRQGSNAHITAKVHTMERTYESTEKVFMKLVVPRLAAADDVVRILRFHITEEQPLELTGLQLR